MSMRYKAFWTDKLRDADPLEEIQFSDFEHSFSVSLTNDYRDLLRTQNGGYVQKYGFTFSVDGTYEESTVDPFYFLGRPDNRSAYNLWNCMKMWRRSGGCVNLIPIGGDGMGGEILMDSSNKGAPVSVCFAGSDEVHPVADSLTAFLRMLQEPSD